MFRFALPFALALGAAGAAMALEPPAIPLAEGTRWIYVGDISGTVDGEDVVTHKLTTMLVKHHRVFGKYEIAVMEAGPLDTAVCSGDESSSHDTLVFVRSGTSYWKLWVQDDSELDSEAAIRARIGDSDPFIVQPLHGRDQMGCKEQAMNCWTVEESKRKLTKIEGLDSDIVRSIYTLTYRSNPDHEVMEIAPGVGIITDTYSHHGTRCDTQFRLLRFTKGK